MREQRKNKILREGSLENGLRFAFLEEPKADIAEIRLFVTSGSVYETAHPGSGITHFLEHVTADGPAGDYSAPELNSLIEKYGNSFNAYTSKDHTCYHITTTGEYAPEALDTLIQMVFRNNLTRKKFFREKGVILRELDEIFSDPASLLDVLSAENLYLEHPARYPIAGYRELLENISYSDIQRYASGVNIPSRALIVAGGNISSSYMEDRLYKAAGNLFRGSWNRPVFPEETPLSGIREKIVGKDITGGYLSLSWLSVPHSHPDEYSLDLLSCILSQGRSSRLNRILIHDKELASSVESYSYTPAYGKGEFTLNLEFSPKQKERVQASLLEAIRDIRDRGVSREETLRAKKLALSSFMFSKSSISGLVTSLGTDILYTGDSDYSEKYIKNIEMVTPEEIQHAASRYLGTDSFASTFILPRKKKFHRNSVARNRSGIPEVSRTHINGKTPLILEENPGSGIVNFAIFFKGGSTYEKNYNLPGLFNFYSSMLSRGTEDYDRVSLEDFFEDRGAAFSSDSGRNSFSLQGASLKGDYKEVLKMLFGILKSPSFDNREIQMQRRLTLEELESERDTAFGEAHLNLIKHIFPDTTPYIYGLRGIRESVERIDKKILRDIHRRFVSSTNMSIAVCGDFEPFDIIKEIEKALESMNDKSDFKEYPPAFIEVSEDMEYLYRTDKELMSLALGFPTVTLLDESKLIPLHIIESLIAGSGYPAGWLHDRMRNKKLSYSVWADNMSCLKSGAFALGASFSKKEYPEVQRVVEGVLRDIKKGRYSENVIRNAARRIELGRKLHIQSPLLKAQKYALHELFGYGYDYDEKYFEVLSKIRTKDIDKVVSEYFKAGVRVITSP